MGDRPTRPEIEAYLREHGGKYTTDALRQQLIAAGHDPAEVDAASLSGLGSSQLNVLLFFAIYATAYLGVGYLLVRVVRATGSAFEIHGLRAVLLGVVLVPVYGGLMFGICAAAATFATTRGG